jgi:multiple sugar transport system permease protein
MSGNPESVNTPGKFSRRNVDEVMSNRYVIIALTILPALALFTFVNLIPILWAVYGGFHEINPFNPQWTFIGISGFIRIITGYDFWMSVYRSLLFAGGSVTFQLLVGTGVALVINRDMKFSYISRTIVMLPYLVPTVIIGFIALWMANPNFGVINQLLTDLGFVSSPINFFSNKTFAMLSLILTSSWKFTIFVTILVLARLQGIPEGFYEAAKISGATAWQRFRDITLPNLKGVIFIVLLLRGVWMFNKFDIIFVLTGGGPIERTTTTSIFVYREAFGRLSMGGAASASTLLFIMLAGVAALYFYYLEPSQEVRTQ